MIFRTSSTATIAVSRIQKTQSSWGIGVSFARLDVTEVPVTGRGRLPGRPFSISRTDQDFLIRSRNQYRTAQFASQNAQDCPGYSQGGSGDGKSKQRQCDM